MAETRDHYRNALNAAVDILRAESARTDDMISRVASWAAQAQAGFDARASVDVERLKAELRHRFSVTAESATALDDRTEHRPWLPARRGEIGWRLWNRYVTYLERDFGMPPAVVASHAELTDMILDRLEDARREPPWDRRGMVVGSVQSGKTANYLGLICKAIDAGYKLVVVLAGLHNNLRAQTQLRMDEGVLGWDTQKDRRLNTGSSRIGVGKLPDEVPAVHSLTNSSESGDFKKTVADAVGVTLGSDPVVLVMKKNVGLLGHLSRWILAVAGRDDRATGRRWVPNVPLLLIDDEADNASINTRARPGADAADSVSATNGSIRKLLDGFEKSAYVGYTATPFANIFIDPDAGTPEHGEDLFPRSFIINVKPPTNYVGPGRVFGIDGDPDAGVESSVGLPIVRELDDFATSFPPKHDKRHVPPDLPESLRLAIRCFILTCAARRARGQATSHNSMLVHVTRFQDVQGHVVRLVGEEVAGLKRRIELGDGRRKPGLREELEALWRQEYEPVSRATGADAGPGVAWDAVAKELHTAASKIDVLTINGRAKEALEYREHEAEGRTVIAIGGDKLSRGLTLEGLSISYFLRTSRMYDTLMQMGRWFGYRTGYLDLCRLFTTKMLVGWYRHIALAEQELRRQFDYMVHTGATPLQYGLRVRAHPGGMIVTALNKMVHARDLTVSWAGELPQTHVVPKEPDAILANLQATGSLLTSLGPPGSVLPNSTLVWQRVPASQVADYLETLRFPRESAGPTGDRPAAFIRAQFGKSPPELVDWTVMLISKSDAEQQRNIAGHAVGLTVRNPAGQGESALHLKNANILGRGDDALDFVGRRFDRAWLDAVIAKPELEADREWLEAQLGQDAWDVSLALTLLWQGPDVQKVRRPQAGRTEHPNGHVVRVLRPPRTGLLLIYPLSPPPKIVHAAALKIADEPTGLDPNGPPIIGVAASFPTSPTAVSVEYLANTVLGPEMQDDEAYAD